MAKIIASWGWPQQMNLQEGYTVTGFNSSTGQVSIKNPDGSSFTFEPSKIASYLGEDAAQRINNILAPSIESWRQSNSVYAQYKQQNPDATDQQILQKFRQDYPGMSDAMIQNDVSSVQKQASLLQDQNYLNTARNASTGTKSPQPTAQAAQTVQSSVQTQTASSGGPVAQTKSQSSSPDTKQTDAKSMSYTNWAKKYKGSYSEWQNARASSASQGDKTTQVPSATSPSVSGATQTISERNKTGMNYTDWANQQRNAGQPYSYQDWLNQSQQVLANTPSQNAPAQADNSFQNGLDIINNSNLDEATKSFFRIAYQEAQGFDAQAVMDAFNKVKTNTIDPAIAEKAKVYGADLQNQINANISNRALETEGEGAAARKRIEDTKAGLEGSGLTFTGEGIKQLGGIGAYKLSPDSKFYEGAVNQANRLIASASANSYMQKMQNLGRQYEDVLGSDISGYNIPGFTPSGVSKGSLSNEQQSMYNQAFSDATQEQQAIKENKEKINVFNQ